MPLLMPFCLLLLHTLCSLPSRYISSCRPSGFVTGDCCKTVAFCLRKGSKASSNGRQASFKSKRNSVLYASYGTGFCSTNDECPTRDVGFLGNKSAWEGRRWWGDVCDEREDNAWWRILGESEAEDRVALFFSLQLYTNLRRYRRLIHNVER